MGLPGEQLMIKMWESLVDRGIGSLLTPWQIRRDGKARNEVRREELLMLAQAEVDANEIRAGRKQLAGDGSLKPVLLPEPPKVTAMVEPSHETKVLDIALIAEKAERVRIAESVKREINVSKAILHAEEILSTDIQAPVERPVEEDWITAWRDYAGRVSTSELQQLWGQILAGEVKSPGTYSLRTLDFLKGLSKKEAEDIAKLAPFVVERFVMKAGRSCYEKKDIGLPFFLGMQELGIVMAVEGVGLSKTWESSRKDCFARVLRSHNKCLLVEHSDPNKLLEMDVYILTGLGGEVLGLGKFEADPEYLRTVGLSIVLHNGFTVGLADWKQETEKTGRYFNAVEIKPDAPPEG